MLSRTLKKNRRSGLERRQFLYDLHIPERRSGMDRRAQGRRNHRKPTGNDLENASISSDEEGDAVAAFA